MCVEATYLNLIGCDPRTLNYVKMYLKYIKVNVKKLEQKQNNEKLNEKFKIRMSDIIGRPTLSARY